jgi:transcriptional antiterminator RfaH
MGLHWYTLYSQPHKERQIDGYLRSKGFTTFYPTLKVIPVNPRAARVRGFFPRYLFVQTDLAVVGLDTLQWIPGAVGLVSFGGEPAVVPDAFILEMRQRIIQIEKAGGLHREGLSHGDQVKIISGSFSGYDAIFDVHLSGEQRVQVLLHWLGREVKLKVNANAVEKRPAL